MNVTIFPGSAEGFVTILPSKSILHRLLILSALSDGGTFIHAGPTQAEDIRATIACLEALGAGIVYQADSEDAPGGFHITPLDFTNLPKHATLPVNESGSTLRFLLPVVTALGVSATFRMAGRLPTRPLAPLDEALTQNGITLTRPTKDTLHATGKLTPGAFVIPGNISSQYITGLLLALPLLDGDSTLTIEGRIESGDYITLTHEAVGVFGYHPTMQEGHYNIKGNRTFHSPGTTEVEGDWSNAAFWLCAGAMPGGAVQVAGLTADSRQGDRAVIDILTRMGAEITHAEEIYTVHEGTRRGREISAAAIPDLIPAIAAVAAVSTGTTMIKNAGRLRLKESDRLTKTARTLNTLGAKVTELPEGLCIEGVARLKGGVVDAAGDHRIAMMAAVASLACDAPVTITGGNAVNKSYPQFWLELSALGKEIHLVEEV